MCGKKFGHDCELGNGILYSIKYSPVISCDPWKDILIKYTKPVILAQLMKFYRSHIQYNYNNHRGLVMSHSDFWWKSNGTDNKPHTHTDNYVYEVLLCKTKNT